MNMYRYVFMLTHGEIIIMVKLEKDKKFITIQK